MKRSNELTLQDYKKIRTSFVFFDETGSINDSSNRFFGLGMIKCRQPHYLDHEVRLIRQRHSFFDEIKWNKISSKNVGVLKEIINQIFSIGGIKFEAYIINKDDVDFKKLYNNNPYKAYQDFTEKLLCNNIAENEILMVLADYISTPNNVHFEVSLKHTINRSLGRLAIMGVHRVESSGVNLIQLVDLLVGAVVYEYKIKNKIVTGDRYKIVIYKYILSKLRITSFIGGVKKKGFKVTEHK